VYSRIPFSDRGGLSSMRVIYSKLDPNFLTRDTRAPLDLSVLNKSTFFQNQRPYLTASGRQRNRSKFHLSLIQF